jgi:hypothetical protein
VYVTPECFVHALWVRAVNCNTHGSDWRTTTCRAIKYSFLPLPPALTTGQWVLYEHFSIRNTQQYPVPDGVDGDMARYKYPYRHNNKTACKRT